MPCGEVTVVEGSGRRSNGSQIRVSGRVRDVILSGGRGVHVSSIHHRANPGGPTRVVVLVPTHKKNNAVSEMVFTLDLDLISASG
jgi:hypothetical protein